MNIFEDIVSTDSIYETGAASLIGTRKYQQDCAYVFADETELLAAVCDGMGGMEGGEKASRRAITCLACDLGDFHEEIRGDVPGFFWNEIQRMNSCVRSLKDRSGMRLKAGTTFAGVYLTGDEMYWASVGDSRIWHIRDGNIKPVNRDHNYRLLLDMMVRNGSMGRDEYEAESRTPKADYLISYIGMERLKLADVSYAPIRLLPGDIVLICSDGVYKSLSDEQVCAMVTDNDIDMYIAADRTNEMALRYGVHGQDNTTTICIRYSGNQKRGQKGCAV